MYTVRLVKGGNWRGGTPPYPQALKLDYPRSLKQRRATYDAEIWKKEDFS